MPDYRRFYPQITQMDVDPSHRRNHEDAKTFEDVTKTGSQEFNAKAQRARRFQPSQITRARPKASEIRRGQRCVEQQAQQATAEQIENFKKAFSVCLEARVAGTRRRYGLWFDASMSHKSSRNERSGSMKSKTILSNWMVLTLTVCICGFGIVAFAEEETAAQAGEKTGIEGTFVRVAENGEGWVVLGYEIANSSVGNEWMLLDVGMTVMQGVKGQKITRDQVKLVTPEGKVLPLPSNEEYAEARGSLAAMTERDNMMHQSINYFPPGADRACRIGFFSDPAQPAQSLSYDEVDLNSQRACIGRLYFHVPGGIQLGNYNLDVQFANSIVRVPMKIMTKEEAKKFEKEWKEAEKKAKHKK